MSLMRESLEGNSISSQKERTQEIEDLWNLYLIWRGGSTAGFVLLGEIEETARVVLKAHLPKQIPFEFVIALMKSTADTTYRFMLARPAQSDHYRKLALEMFWNGVATIGISDEREG